MEIWFWLSNYLLQELPIIVIGIREKLVFDIATVLINLSHQSSTI